MILREQEDIEGKIGGRTGATGRKGRRGKQLLDDYKGKRG
jgi:hypothetical protein